VGTHGEYSHLYTEERGHRRNQPADSLILDFQPPELLYELSGGWHSVLAAPEDQFRGVAEYVKLGSKAPWCSSMNWEGVKVA